jgi:hypothetical protein
MAFTYVTHAFEAHARTAAVACLGVGVAVATGALLSSSTSPVVELSVALLGGTVAVAAVVPWADAPVAAAVTAFGLVGAWCASAMAWHAPCVDVDDASTATYVDLVRDGRVVATVPSSSTCGAAMTTVRVVANVVAGVQVVLCLGVLMHATNDALKRREREPDVVNNTRWSWFDVAYVGDVVHGAAYALGTVFVWRAGLYASPAPVPAVPWVVLSYAWGQDHARHRVVGGAALAVAGMVFAAVAAYRLDAADTCTTTWSFATTDGTRACHVALAVWTAVGVALAACGVARAVVPANEKKDDPLYEEVPRHAR